ncbi:MAG: type II and III secretion system protein family protein [Xanthobacteraceae bacterium]
MNSQYRDQNNIAGGGRPHLDGTTIIRSLTRRSGAALVAALLGTMAPLTIAAHAQQHAALASPMHPRTIPVTLGKSQDVQTKQSIGDIVVSDPSVADVNPLTDHALSIFGKKGGTARVTVYDADKKLIDTFDIEVGLDISPLVAEIAQFANGSIKVSSINGRVLLSGIAPDAATLDKAVQMARQFVPDANGVINTVRVMQQQQVMLEVRFIEVDRQASRQLGVQWNYFGNSALANVGNQVTPNNQAPPFPGAPQLPLASTAGTVAAGVLSGTSPYGFLLGQLSNRVQVAVNALEQQGLARSLAEPNLVALSGDTASFLAGGEIPIPEAGSLGTVSFAYKPYGVGLSFTPTVLRDGLINLMIKPEVSQIDTAHTVTVAGTSVPGLITRKASTTLELRDGQSFMLGGLLQDTGTTAQDQLPWVGDVPVLGALFRSSQYQKNETDLVIVVTPHIVRPMPATVAARTPLDGTEPGNDIDFFLMGKAEVSPALVRLAAGALNRPYVGHILDLPKKGGVYVSVKD